MRLFIAIDLPEEIKEELLRIQKGLPEAKLRLVKKEHIHLTLKFLGEVSPAKAEKIKEALSEIRFKPFKTALSETGVFSSGKFVRVVWVDLKPNEEIIELQKQIDEALQKSFPKDKKFTAHLTIARVKFVRDKEEFITKLKELEIKKIEFEIKNFTLKKSILTPQGPIHEDVAEFPDLQSTK